MERYAMYDPAVRAAVLRLLRRWKRLPLGDLLEMLSPVERLRYRDGVIADLEWEGLIRQQRIGDESVVELTEVGAAEPDQRPVGQDERRQLPEAPRHD